MLCLRRLIVFIDRRHLCRPYPITIASLPYESDGSNRLSSDRFQVLAAAAQLALTC